MIHQRENVMAKMIVALIRLTVSAAVAQQPMQQAPTLATTSHTGVLVYQRTFPKDQPDNLYHIGGYGCTEGSEHRGPDCAPDPVTPSFYETETLTLEDGRKLNVHGGLVDIARLETIAHGNSGKWNVLYEFEESRLNPFTGHTIQYVKVVFPVTISGKILPITKHIVFDVSDKYLNASTIEDK